jgi:hypothetical protein
VVSEQIWRRELILEVHHDTVLLDLHQACGLNEAAEQVLGRGLIEAVQPLGPGLTLVTFFCSSPPR